MQTVETRITVICLKYVGVRNRFKETKLSKKYFVVISYKMISVYHENQPYNYEKLNKN